MHEKEELSILYGLLKSIHRYPVKSFNGERVNDTKVLPHGLYGDRSHAYKINENKYLTQTQLPQMSNYTANFDGEESMDSYPRLTITNGTKTFHSYDDPDLLLEMESLFKQPITPICYKPQYTPFGAIERDHILLLTEQSILELENLIQMPVNPLRFRPNLILDLQHSAPFLEEEWIGKQLRIGQVVLKITKKCDRCSIINIDPENGLINSKYLKGVYKKRKSFFGVYASVVKPGAIAENDAVYFS